MIQRMLRRPARSGRTLLSVLVLTAFGIAARNGFWSNGTASPVDNLPRAIVRRTDLQIALRAGGQIESSDNTVIECELESLHFRSEGQSLNVRGASRIIELIPDGSTVRKDDVLCRLDASEFEELVRQQAMKLDQAKALHEGARLDFEGAEIALREYHDGRLEQLKQQMEGQIALARADLKRQEDRVVWTDRMIGLRYLPTSRGKLERESLERTQIELKRGQLALSNLLKYTAPKMILSLQGAVESAKTQLAFSSMRVKRTEDQLVSYREQVERCTIRAPHDGFVIFANDEANDRPIELGSTVRQNQDLFFLPDLSRMEVETLLHETVVDRVHEGMPARVRVEALPQVTLEGHVVSVAPLPQSQGGWGSSDEVKNFVGRVQLHVVPEGLKPGMSAEVEIMTAQRPETLVIPPSALTVEQGREVCYVTGKEGVERREVKVGEVAPDMVEVTQGLREGEEVIVEPSQFVERGVATDSPTLPSSAEKVAMVNPLAL